MNTKHGMRRFITQNFSAVSIRQFDFPRFQDDLSRKLKHDHRMILHIVGRLLLFSHFFANHEELFHNEAQENSGVGDHPPQKV